MRSEIKAAFVLIALSGGCSGTRVDPPPHVLFEAANPFQADTAIRLGRLVSPADGRVIDGAIVLIKGDRVVHVGTDAARIPPKARVVDWSRYTGLPGIVDAHTHVAFVTDEAPGIGPWERMDELDDATSLRLARKNAALALRVGVTTMIDKGCRTGIDRKLKREIERGETPGPRMFIATEGISRQSPSYADRRLGTVRESSDIVPEIRREAKSGSDFIKLWADWCSDRVVDCQPTFTPDEMRTAVDEAHRLGLPIAIHAYHGEVAKEAVLAGVNVIDHPAGLDKATIDEIVKRGTIYIPTVDHNRYYEEHASLFGTSGLENKALLAYLDDNLKTMRAAHKAGARIAMGSDAVFSMFGQNTRELAWFVKAGMTPMEALRAATINGAASIGKEREIGSVAPGYFADIIAVAGDPLADIRVVIQGVKAVMVGGRILEPRTEAPEPSAATPDEAPVPPDVPAGADADRDAELRKRARGLLSGSTNSDADFVPGSKKVVFVSDRDGLAQLYLGDASKPSARPLRLVTTTERVDNPTVMPDGKSVVFRSDRLKSSNWSLFRVDLDGKNLVELTPGVEMERDPPFFPADVSPPVMVYSASGGEWRKRVLIQELAPGAKAKLVYLGPLPGGLADVTRDAKWALLMQQSSPSLASVILVDLASGAGRAMYPPASAKKEVGVRDAVFAGDAKARRVIIAEDEDGERLVLHALDLATGEEKARHVDEKAAGPGSVDMVSSKQGDLVALRLTTGDHTSIRLFDAATLKLKRAIALPIGAGWIGDFSKDGERLSVTFGTPSRPVDIHAADVRTGKLAPLRDDPRPELADLGGVEVSITEVRSFDGMRVPVNVYLPSPRKGARKPAPVLVMVHRGPADSAVAGWDAMRRFYLAEGFAIVEPNIRGSTGFGRAYELADNGPKRLHAVKDVEAVARWATGEPWADKEKLVIFGMDYGGFITLVELSQRAEIWRAGVNLFGYTSLRSILSSRVATSSPSFAVEFGDPIKDAEFVDSMSPVRDAGAIKDPLFVYTSATDARVPRSEVDPIVKTLRDKKVPVEYMVASDEGHSLRRLDNQIDVLARSARFLEHALAAKEAPARAP